MLRKAFVMEVNAGAEEEYARRHNPVWPELERVLRAHGVHSYSIFIDTKTRLLFAYAEIEDESRWDSIASTLECQHWWRYMQDVTVSSVQGVPVTRDLTEVFHLELGPTCQRQRARLR